MAEPEGEKSLEAVLRRRSRVDDGALSNDQAVELSRHVASLASAGLPMPSGLRALAEELPENRLKTVLNRVADDVEAGESLDAALRAQGSRFPSPLRGLITAGSRSGHLAESLGSFLDIHEMGVSLRRQLSFSLIYPTLLIFVGAAVFVFGSITITQSFMEVFRDFGVDLPFMTTQLIRASEGIYQLGSWMFIGPVVAVVTLWLAMRVLLGKAERHEMIHLLPLIGPLARYTAIGEFFAVLSLLLESEVPLPEALELTADASKDFAMAAAARRMAIEVSAGSSLGESMEGRRPFPRGYEVFVAWAEQSRGLVDALRLSAETFEVRARSQARFVSRFCNVMAMTVVLWWVSLTVIGLLYPLMSLLSILNGSAPAAVWNGWAVVSSIAIALVGFFCIFLFVYLLWRYRQLFQAMGLFFSLGAILVCTPMVAMICFVFMTTILKDWIPEGWIEAVTPAVGLELSLISLLGVVLMVFCAFRAPSRPKGSLTRKRFHLPRVVGPQMTLRHLMFAMVPLSFLFVLAKNFGWSLPSIVIMLAPPVVVVGLIVVVTNRRISLQDALLRVMAVAARENQPLGPAVLAFAATCRGGYRSHLISLAHSLQEGRSLAQALAAAPRALSPEGAVIARVGFETNTLAQSLEDAVTAIATRRSSHVAAIGLIGYPLTVLTAVLGGLSFLCLFGTARFQAIFHDFGIPLPEPMRTISTWVGDFHFEVGESLFFTAGLLLVFLGMVACVVWTGLPQMLRNRLLRRRHTSILLRSIAAAIEHEQTMTSIFQQLQAIYPLRWVQRKLRKATIREMAGEPWWSALAAEGLIGRADAAVLQSASGVGNLPWALREMADSGERRLTYRLQAMAQMLQSAMIIALGLMALVVAITYFRPMIALIENLSGMDL